MDAPTILIIDDDPDLLRELSGVLTAAGYKTITVQGVQGAEPILHRRQPEIDLVIVDLVLPGTSGFDIISIITRKARTFKILACSGVYRMPLLERVSKAIGADGFIEKPVPGDAAGHEEWLTTIRRLLGSAGAAVRA